MTPSSASAAADLAARISDLLGPDRLSAGDPAEFAIDGLVPRVVVEPKNAHETARALALAAGLGAGVGVLGGGTRRRLGNRPSRLDVVVSTRSLRDVVEHVPADFVITARAGITLADLADATALHGQRFALDPPARLGSTLGGALSADASGPHRYLCGTARDLVIGIEAALPNGTVVRSGGRVVKSVAGYDFRKLFLGAIGTLGVITAASLRLNAIPEEDILVAAGFGDPEAAGRCAARLLREGLDLEAIDLVNASVARAIFAGDLSSDRVLVLSLAGPPGATAAQAEEAEALCAKEGADATRLLARDEARVAWDRLRAACLAADHEVALRVSVPPGEAARFAAETERLLAPMSPPRIVSRAGNGIVTVLLRSGDAGAMAEGVRDLRARAAVLGGGVVIESAPPEVKEAIEVWGASGPIVTLSRKVKEAFDPLGVMAPGRFAGRI